ncbi:MAG: hypothetical protein ACXWLV_01485 [Rhizomicrobium sp.]
MKSFRLAVAAFAALALAGCYPPTTNHPIGTTTGLRPDPVLVGLWKGVPPDPGERGGYFHFLPQLDGTITVILVQAGDKPDGDWNLITTTTGKAGANRFMNVRMLSSNGKPEEGAPTGTVPVLYRIDARGEMTLYMMDETATGAAITSGQVKGVVEKGAYGDVIITADPKALDKFMQGPAAIALFKKPFFTLHRME